MIEGLIFLTELVMMFLLLLGVLRSTKSGLAKDMGLFEPKVNPSEDPPSPPGSKGGHA